MFSVASSKMKEYPPSIAFFPRNGIIIPSDYHMLTFVSFPQCLVQRRANSGPYKMVKSNIRKWKDSSIMQGNSPDTGHKLWSTTSALIRSLEVTLDKFLIAFSESSRRSTWKPHKISISIVSHLADSLVRYSELLWGKTSQKKQSWKHSRMSQHYLRIKLDTSLFQNTNLIIKITVKEV